MIQYFPGSNSVQYSIYLKDNNYFLAYVGSSTYSLNANYSNTEKWSEQADKKDLKDITAKWKQVLIKCTLQS